MACILRAWEDQLIRHESQVFVVFLTMRAKTGKLCILGVCIFFLLPLTTPLHTMLLCHAAAESPCVAFKADR
jgi:hypothetical protein